MKRNEKPSITHISPFPFPLAIIITPLFLLILACSSSTEISKGDLTGSVYLDGSDDHTGISVALYDLAYLDTTIVRINREYPHIGVIINQHTEFDHRLQSPVATSTTLADGSFLIEDVPKGVYNFVAQKAGWGFRYVYEVEIAEGENELSSMKNVQCIINNDRKEAHFSSFIFHSSLRERSDLTLFSEVHIAGDVNDNITVAPFHHLVCDDDVTFIPGSSLDIQPNAVVRIAPGADLKIMGIFKAQGEENNMFWVTSNHGFENDELLISNSQLGTNPNSLNYSKFKIQNSKLLARDSDIELYNSMSLESTASVQNDLIEWGKWDYANTCLLNKVDNLTMQNGVFRKGSCGYQVADVVQSFAKNCIANKLDSEEHAGVYFYLVLTGQIEKSIFTSSENGIKLKDKSNIEISNNFITRNSYGIKLWQCIGDIHNNEFLKNVLCDIGFTGNQEIETGLLSINFNVFSSEIGIMQFEYLSWAHNRYNDVITNSNNFLSTELYIRLLTERFNKSFTSEHGCFQGEIDDNIIHNKIYDFRNDDELIEVDVNNPVTEKNSNAGIF